MKIKTLILTFFMMMSSPFLFGQHWVDPTLPGEDVMTVTAKVTLDGELQSGESYEVAVFNGDKLVEVGTFTNHGIPELEYHVGLTIPGGEGDKFYFKFFNGTNEYVSLTEIDYADEQGSHLNLFTIEFKSVAQIGNVVYPSLQDAIDAAANEDVITLLQANAENVTVVQAPGVAFTIDGAENTMTGTITVNGKSAAYPTAGLTIKNVNFDATNIADASIMLGVKNDNNTRYTNGVIVQDCNFTGDWDTTGEEKSAIKNYTGGCKNLTVTGCTFTGLHSLMQVKGVNGITISGVTVENCKNGIAVGTSTNVAISGSTISATGYGVRADGDGAYTMTLTNNNISAELPVVVRNAKEVAYNLTIEGDNNNYTASNENGYQVVFTTGDDGTYVAPTKGQFVLTVPENFNVYPVYVAQVGDNKYTSIVKAINEAADGATVQLLPGTIDEYVYPWPESNHSKEKSITIVGAENYGTTITAGMFLGYDDSQCREHNITVKGIKFTGKGLTVACQQNVTIEDNKFNYITEGRAIAVIGKNINSVVKNNVIDNVTTSQVGIELRNTLTATVEGNIISNTGHNSLQITSQVDATNSTITVKNNTMSNWGTAENAQGELEGRAMRISNIVTATISGNVMSHTAAPEEFVKVTGATTLDVSANYWNGNSPLTEGMFAGVEGDLVPVLVSYYTDAEKKNLVTLAPSVAEINGTYYQDLETALKAATENCTINILTDITIDYKWDCRYTGARLYVPVTINGNDNTIYFTGEVSDANWNTLFRFENNATVKNLTLDASAATSIQRGISTKLSVTVENCTLIGNGTTAQRAVIVGESAGAENIVNVTATITGSTFRNWKYGVSDNQNAQDMKEIVITDCIFDNANVLISAKENVTFMGNNMSENSYVNISSYTTPNEVVVVATDNTLAANTDTKYNQINAKLENITAQEGFLTPVAEINGKNYFDLQKAIDAATEGQTVTVLANVELEKTVTVAAGKVVTLDLNGNVVSGVCNSGQAHLFMVQNTAELTVKDSSENQEGKISYARGTSGTGWAIDLEGELVLESGTIELTGESWSIGYVVDIRPNSWGTEYTEATTFTMNGGKLVSSFDAIRIASSSADGSQDGGVVHENVSANFVMNNGEIVSNRDAIFVQQSNEAYDILNFQVNDGRISGAQSLIRLYGPAATSVVNNVENPITLDLNGGTFDYTGSNLEDTRWLVPGVIMVAGGATFEEMLDYTGFEITGGTYDGDVSAYCAFGYTCQDNGDGTYGIVETDGFEIPNLDRLVAFRNAVNAGNNFKGQTVTVTDDISMGDVENWTPIGTMDTPFMGTFDGGNFTISNLKAEGEKYVGLFGYANKATIKNVKIENANVYGVESVGALAGSVYSESTIENCHVSGLIQVEGLTKVGGIHGYGYAKIINSSVVGSGDSYIKGTYVQADQEGDNVGGIVGHGGEGNTIEACTVKDIKVIGTRKVGGIVGTTDRAKVLDNCLVDGVVIENTAEATYAENNAATTTIGGLIGNYHGNGKGGSVINCVVKNVTFTVGNAKNVGPIVGGYRNAPNEEPTDVTASGNLIYMSTISDNTTNTYLMHAVAQIGETEYYTLQDAVTAAANAETTITYIASTKEEIAIQEDANITLNFAENVTLDGNIIVPNANLTINNGIISNTNSAKSGIQVNAGTLNLNGVNITSARHALRLEGTNGEVVATINGGTYKLHEVTSQTQHVLNAGGDGEQVTVTILGGTFVGPRGTNSDSGAAINAQTNAIVTIEGGDFSGGKNNTLSKKEAATITVTGGTYDQDPTAYVAQGYVVKYNETTSRYEVFLGVAKIEETGAIYGTLAQAVSAAQQGDTITLLADINENVTIKNKKLTIDGGEFNSTGLITTNITTAYPLTFKNFNIDGAANYFVRVDGGGGNYTFDNCNIKNSWGIIYTIKSTNTVTIKNSTVDNCSYGVGHFVALNSATIENVTVTNSNKGVYVQNQASKKVTFKNCNISATKPFDIWEKSTYEITFNIEGETDVNNVALNTGSYYKYVLSAEGAKLIGAQEGLDITTTVEGCVVEYEEGETEGFGTYSVIPGNVELVRGEESVGKFATIQAAIDAAQNGDVVRIVSEDTFVMDITTGVTNSDSYYVLANVADKEVVIDLNGRTVTVDVTNLPEGCKSNMLMSVFCADVNGKLTLKDSGEDGSVSVTGGATNTVYSLAIAYEGLVNIESGSYSIDYMNEGRGMIYDNVSDHAGEDGSNLNKGVNISGGNFTLGNVGTLANGSPWILAASGSNSGKYVFVTGGTYNDDILHQHWAFEVLAPVNKALQNNGDGTYSIVDAVAFVKQHEYSGYYTETGYATLGEAFMRAHTAGDIITLLQDITLEESITVNAEQEVVLDLNGKVVSYESATVGEDMITNKGKLTIESNVEGGKLTYNNSDETGTNVTISTISTEPGSELIINSGIIENTSLANNTSNVLVPYTIDILTNGNLGDVAVTINGGSIISENYIAIRQFVNGNVCNNSLIVKDGTIQALKRAINVQDAQGTGEVKNCAKLLVEGGNITATDENGYSICNLANSENISVTGGNFVGQVYSAIDGIITGGTFNMEPYFAYCAEGFAAVDNGNGTWTVMPTQEQSLLNGWNWYSTYLDITLNDLTTTLGDNGISIKNFNGITKENNGGFWMGTLNEINPSEMYMIQTTTECDLKLAADLLNPNEHQISLSANWNWIGYPSNQEVAINVALANIPEPKEGDIIKSLNNGYAEYAFGLWIGTLNTMVPGVGYKYNNKSGEAKTFYYNIEATRGAVEANVTAENNYWTPNATKYPHNMTMTAVVDGLTNGNYEVAAFVNGEVRGSARPVYVEALDAYIFFLTIHGEDVEEMSFRLYDIDTDTEYDLNDRINYSNDAHLGSISEPYVFSRGTTGIGEAALSEINIYPNPTTTGSTIRLQTICDRVEVYNALGVLVAEYHNVDTIDALETAGIYVIRITNDGNTQNCRLVVK